MIFLKQKATVAMALSIADDKYLIQDIKNKNIKKDYYKDLIAKYKQNTPYKNIWIQIFDENVNSLYRSWSLKKGDNLKHIRQDLVNVVINEKIASSVSVGKFDLSIKAIIPLFSDAKLVGIIEVVSHFDSISQELKKSNIDSVVVLKKEFKKQLKYPITKLFIDDDYYVANIDAPKYARDYLKENGVEKYFNNSYKIQNAQIIASYELKNKNEKPVGYYIMFKKIDTISDMDLDFFMFKWLAFGIIILIGIAFIAGTMLFFANRRQKLYYQSIIDSATNVVVVNNKKEIIDVNKAFYKYFDRFKNLKEFKKEHDCVCDFFVKEEGYIQKEMHGVIWVEYLIQNKSLNHKVKIDLFGKIYYFSISASKIYKDNDLYSIILSDITEQENYKKELEHLSITDALTGIGNRRYFHNKIEEEIQRAKRYKHSLSLIMFDIDFFKEVNDKHGHGVGDEVLVEYTKLVNSLLRDSDIFCRVGGEEFVVIIPHASRDEAQQIAEKLRIEIEKYKKVVPITMSFGVVEYILGEDASFIFKRVDDALYKAKESGRNIVVVG